MNRAIGRLARVVTLFAVLCLPAIVPGGEPPPGRDPLVLVSFNAWGAGANVGLGVDETVAVLRASGADIVGLQEARGEGGRCTTVHCPPEGEDRASLLAEALGWNVLVQPGEGPASWANAVLSRHSIVGRLPEGLGAVVDVGGLRVRAWNLHLTDFPYQPYQLLGIPYGDAPELANADAAVNAARSARGAALALLEAALDSAPPGDVDVLFGDFNEPSHRDWTPSTVTAGHHPVVVAWPFTLALERGGWVDAYRAVHPDALERPGFTWTPSSDPADPSDHHDRIDFIFVRGHGLEVVEASVIGETHPLADLVVQPWPSDHRAVRATLRVP